MKTLTAAIFWQPIRGGSVKVWTQSVTHIYIGSSTTVTAIGGLAFKVHLSLSLYTWILVV